MSSVFKKCIVRSLAPAATVKSDKRKRINDVRMSHTQVLLPLTLTLLLLIRLYNEVASRVICPRFLRASVFLNQKGPLFISHVAVHQLMALSLYTAKFPVGIIFSRRSITAERNGTEAKKWRLRIGGERGINKSRPFSNLLLTVLCSIYTCACSASLYRLPS